MPVIMIVETENIKVNISKLCGKGVKGLLCMVLTYGMTVWQTKGVYSPSASGGQHVFKVQVLYE